MGSERLETVTTADGHRRISRRPVPVIQEWVCGLTFMQQSVLIASVRGPDGLPKLHVAKYILRWLRRCTLISAFDGKVLDRPYIPGGGSFTGPSMDCYFDIHPENDNRDAFDEIAEGKMAELAHQYLDCVDEIPHHFQLHLMHAAEIIGYKHPDSWVRGWWIWFYRSIVNDAHLFPETEDQMDSRLGDNEQ